LWRESRHVWSCEAQYDSAVTEWFLSNYSKVAELKLKNYLLSGRE